MEVKLKLEKFKKIGQVLIMKTIALIAHDRKKEEMLAFDNTDKKQTEKQTGKVQVKGSKFKLDIPGNTIVCDGKTIWAHNKDANEVTIKSFDANNEDQLNPSKIFTMYETGYKYKYEKEEKSTSFPK